MLGRPQQAGLAQQQQAVHLAGQGRPRAQPGRRRFVGAAAAAAEHAEGGWLQQAGQATRCGLRRLPAPPLQQLRQQLLQRVGWQVCIAPLQLRERQGVLAACGKRNGGKGLECFRAAQSCKAGGNATGGLLQHPAWLAMLCSHRQMQHGRRPAAAGAPWMSRRCGSSPCAVAAAASAAPSSANGPSASACTIRNSTSSLGACPAGAGGASIAPRRPGRQQGEGVPAQEQLGARKRGQGRGAAAARTLEVPCGCEDRLAHAPGCAGLPPGLQVRRLLRLPAICAASNDYDDNM